MPGAKPYTLRDVLRNPLARMLPLQREQFQAYRLGEKIPPSALIGHGPIWEAVSFIVGARQTLQARVNLQRDFTLIALSGSATSQVNGGFRYLAYDMKRRLRFADRPVQQATGMGTGGPAQGGYILLREPYRFSLADSQLYVAVQNLETVQNTIQIVFFGMALRFNEPGVADFPGGPVSTARGR